MPEVNMELKRTIAAIIKETIALKIDWKNINPTTFQWINLSLGAMKSITVQKVSNDRYVFQIHDHFKQEVVLSIDSKEKPEYKNLLKALHTRIESSLERKGLDLLKRFLGDAPLANSDEFENEE